jgi:hypothetical protein
MDRIARLGIVFAFVIGLLAALPMPHVFASPFVNPASISANPQNVPFGQFTTTISFSNSSCHGSGCGGPPPFEDIRPPTLATVCVSANGSPQAIFAEAPADKVDAPFIESGAYVFTLHDGAGCAGATLASVTVHKLTPDGTTNASIVVTPPSFDVQAGVLSDTATVSWDTGTDLPGQVSIVVNNADTHGILAKSTYGTVKVPWVQSGVYAFSFSFGGPQSKTVTATAKGGIAISASSVPAGTPFTVTANSGTGAPVLICLNAHLSPTSIPFTLGNSGIASGDITRVAGVYNFNVYVPADGKTPLTAASLATGTGGQPCTANTPLVPLMINGLLVSGHVTVT